MARPPSITDDQILEAAVSLFIERGFDVPTSEIAARACVSEGTIFKRFQTKEQLFIHAMRHSSQRSPWIEHLDQLCTRGDLKENLEIIAAEILDMFLIIMPRIHVVLSQHHQLREQLLGHPEAPPLIALKHLAHFFDREQRAGRLRRTDPEILARTFLGALQHYCLFDRLGLNEYAPMPRTTYVRGIVALILDGVSPTPPHA